MLTIYLTHNILFNFLKLLNNFKLFQHDSLPTQNSGHILDLIIMKISPNLGVAKYCIDSIDPIDLLLMSD